MWLTELRNDLASHRYLLDRDCQMTRVARLIADLYALCPDCGGRGTKAQVTRGGLLDKATWLPCPRCSGTGVVPSVKLCTLLSSGTGAPPTWKNLAHYLGGTDAT